MRRSTLRSAPGEVGGAGLPTGAAAELGANLYEFLWSDQPGGGFHLVEPTGGGWIDGGCRILAEGVQEWLGPENARLVTIDNGDQHAIEHVAVKVGSHYIDGDGVATGSELLDRWELTENVPNPEVRGTDRDILDSTVIPKDGALSAKVATALAERFPWARALNALWGKKDGPSSGAPAPRDVVYHGTRASLDALRRDGLRVSDSDGLLFFADDPDVAQEYAERAQGTVLRFERPPYTQDTHDPSGGQYWTDEPIAPGSLQCQASDGSWHWLDAGGGLAVEE